MKANLYICMNITSVTLGVITMSNGELAAVLTIVTDGDFYLNLLKVNNIQVVGNYFDLCQIITYGDQFREQFLNNCIVYIVSVGKLHYKHSNPKYMKMSTNKETSIFILISVSPL